MTLPAAWNNAPLVIGRGGIGNVNLTKPGLKPESTCECCDCSCWKFIPPRFNEYEISADFACDPNDIISAFNNGDAAEYYTPGRCYDDPEDTESYYEIPIVEARILRIFLSCCYGNQGSSDDDFGACSTRYADQETDCEIQCGTREAWSQDTASTGVVRPSLYIRNGFDFKASPCLWNLLQNTFIRQGDCIRSFGDPLVCLALGKFSTEDASVPITIPMPGGGSVSTTIDCRKGSDRPINAPPRLDDICDGTYFPLSGGFLSPPPPKYCFYADFLIVRDQCGQEACIELFDYDPDGECCCGHAITVEIESTSPGAGTTTYNIRVYCALSGGEQCSDSGSLDYEIYVPGMGVDFYTDTSGCSDTGSPKSITATDANGAGVKITLTDGNGCEYCSFFRFGGYIGSLPVGCSEADVEA